ncbi:hypothetical protein ABZ297_27120 [Nonomuraea sp. NPDC005983]|uniref:hypothetical protein n=1 Tax=Nonomuraea sp. NPDC005983 TaxID=3155595 RepID=UPI0033A3512E
MKGRMRTLRIGDRAFLWTAQIRHTKHGADCRRYVRLRVWGGGKNSGRLQADLLSTYEGGPWGYCATDTAFPTPRDVRAIVDHALAAGWNPLARNGAFQLPADSVELPDFQVTHQDD